MSIKRYLDKLEEKKANDKIIDRNKKDPNYDGYATATDITKRISFHIALKEWAPGISVLGSSYGDEARDLLIELDDEDMEYFRKKYVNSQALRDEEYKKKLDALKREYGK
jgi:hypothetical protein